MTRHDPKTRYNKQAKSKEALRLPERVNYELKATCPDSEYSVRFLQGMLDRMHESHEKHGSVIENYPAKFTALPNLEKRLLWCFVTRNQRYLVDAANFAMIEFLRPQVVGAFFQPTDSDQSPGRKFVGEESSTKANTSKATISKPQLNRVSLALPAAIDDVSVEFMQGMVNRMTVSFFKYGRVSEGFPERVNASSSLFQRVAKYLETANTEFLIDVANFAMIEFMYPSVVGAYLDLENAQPPELI